MAMLNLTQVSRDGAPYQLREAVSPILITTPKNGLGRNLAIRFSSGVMANTTYKVGEKMEVGYDPGLRIFEIRPSMNGLGVKLVAANKAGAAYITFRYFPERGMPSLPHKTRITEFTISPQGIRFGVPLTTT